MTLNQPYALLLFLPLAAFLFWQWRTGASRRRLWVHAASLIMAILALSDPRMYVNETKNAVAVLVDTSASSAGQLAQANEIVNRLNNARGRHELKIIPFARHPREVRNNEVDPRIDLKAATGEEARSTDLEGAVRYALATFPSGKVPRLVLVTDGQETAGSVSRAAWQARQLNLPIDAYPLTGLRNAGLRIDKVVVPPVAYVGERFPVEVNVYASKPASASIEIAAEGKTLGKSNVSLETGINRLTLDATLPVAGAIELSGRLDSPTLGTARFAEAIQLRKARVYLVNQDPIGSEQYLASVLTANQIALEGGLTLPADLSPYHEIILNNIDLESIPEGEKNRLEKYVQEGGGLLVIGGERNLYREGKKLEDALDRVLPAKLAPPRSPEGTVVVLIIDKSSSMEGRKMDLARTAAIGVIDNLRPQDTIGVLIFDNSFQWAVPLRKAEDRVLIKRLVAGITPDGGTQIAPAVSEAVKKTLPAKGLYKHIVLLTDGISEEGDSLNVAKEASDRKITISTVGLGQDVNRTYLEKLASSAKGKSYFLVDPSGLEQILLKDVQEHTGGTTVERDLKPSIISKESPLLDGVDMANAPALKGYVRFEPKTTAEVVLKLDEKDPLLSRWQLGLGKAAVFASDAKSRWAADWITWAGYPKFWANVVQDLLPRTQSVDAQAQFDPATRYLTVQYKQRPEIGEPARLPELFVLGPDNFRKPLKLERLAAGRYRGEIALGSRQGMFRVRPVNDSLWFPETGTYVEEPEFRLAGTNSDLLKQVANYTGGLYEPAPDQVFASGRRGAEQELAFWPTLLGLAIALNLLELGLRKLSGWTPPSWFPFGLGAKA